MDIVRPLRANDPNSALSGYVVARFDPDDFLYPLIRRWPGDSRTGETNLVRLDGDQVLYLHQSNPMSAQPGLRMPLSSPELLAATALQTRGTGVAAGVDHFGTPVFGAFTEVGATGWMIVAKMSQEEALAPVSELASWISLLMFLAITAITVVLILMWRQQQRAWELSLRVSTAERDGLVRQFYDLPFLGMAFNNPSDASWMQFNDTLCHILGYSREELQKMDWSQVTHPEDRPAEQEAMEKILRGESDGYRMEKRLLRKGGAISHATIDVKAVRNDEGGVQLLVAMLQDISERKRAELEVQKLTRYYVALSQMNEMIVRERDSQRVMDEACKIAETSGKLALVWIGRADDTTRTIVPLASSGASRAYLNELHISVNPDLDIGRGPTALAYPRRPDCRLQSVSDGPSQCALACPGRTLGAAQHGGLSDSAPRQALGRHGLLCQRGQTTSARTWSACWKSSASTWAMAWMRCRPRPRSPRPRRSCCSTPRCWNPATRASSSPTRRTASPW
jgi:PAS domain S-box-containing protein